MMTTQRQLSVFLSTGMRHVLSNGSTYWRKCKYALVLLLLLLLRVAS